MKEKTVLIDSGNYAMLSSNERNQDSKIHADGEAVQLFEDLLPWLRDIQNSEQLLQVWNDHSYNEDSEVFEEYPETGKLTEKRSLEKKNTIVNLHFEN